MNYSLLKDCDLIELLKNSDKKAFEEIYRRYWAAVFRYAIGKVHTQQVAEDLCQDLFVSLWQRRAVVTIKNIEAYLIQATKYGVLNHIRLKIQDRKHLSVANVQPEFVASQNRAGLQNLMHAWDKALALLPPKTGEVFRLSKLEDYSNKEIAGVMHITEKAVEYHITKSHKIMRLQLRDFIVFIAAFAASITL